MASAVSYFMNACRAVLRSAATADQTTPATAQTNAQRTAVNFATLITLM